MDPEGTFRLWHSPGPDLGYQLVGRFGSEHAALEWAQRPVAHAESDAAAGRYRVSSTDEAPHRHVAAHYRRP